MNKLVDIVFVIFGIIGLIGSVFLIWGLGLFDAALNDLISADPTVGNLGFDLVTSQQLAKQVKGTLLLGWIWSIIVFVSSLALIYLAVTDLRKQRSVVGRKK